MWPDEYEYAKANMTKFNLQEKIKIKLFFFESWTKFCKISLKSDTFVIEYKLTHTWGKELVYQYGHRHVFTNPNDHLLLLEPG